MQNNIFSGLFVGQNLIKLNEVDSTNNYLKNLLSNSKPLPAGTVIMAEHQFAGRGQNNNKWLSQPGKNLTFSIYLRPSFIRLDEQFMLNKSIALGLIDCLTNIMPEHCKIKWPNDIYYKDKKLGGILIENIARGYILKESIIGIGLNVNQEVFENELQNAVSLKQMLHNHYDLMKLLADICKSIESRYMQLKAGNEQKISEDFLNSLYRLNEDHQYLIKGEIVEACIIGVARDGCIITKSKGITMHHNLKEIEFII